MAIPVVESTAGANSGTSAVSNLAITKPSGLAVGDMLIVAAASDSTSGTLQFDQTPNNVRNTSDGTDAGFTWIQSGGSATVDCHSGAWYKIMTSADVSSGSWRVDAQSSQQLCNIAIRVSGSQDLGVQKANAEESGSNVNADWTTTLTTVQANMLVFHAAAFDGADMTPITMDGVSTTAGWTITAEETNTSSGDYCSMAVCQKDQASAADAGELHYNTAAADGKSGFFFAVAEFTGIQILRRRRG